ncbi:MAG: hypothetical protein JXA09_13730 [Anaerolineae bacterium]|nr:hypothetical protein [Anaerolineae bacterium]
MCRATSRVARAQGWLRKAQLLLLLFAQQCCLVLPRLGAEHTYYAVAHGVRCPG